MAAAGAPGPPDPARLAAADQRLAEMCDRLDRHARAGRRGDIALMVITLAGAAYELTARPAVHRWDLTAALAVIALLAVRNFVQGMMLRSYRAEIHDLRAGGYRRL